MFEARGVGGGTACDTFIFKLGMGRVVGVVGRHVYGELYGVDKAAASNEPALRELVLDAANAANAKVLEVKSWRIDDPVKGGVSVIALVLESHIAVHTWPYYDYATVDVYTCGDHTDPFKAFQLIVDRLRPKRYTVNFSDRSQREAT